MFIGRSYGDGIRPSSVQSLADCRRVTAPAWSSSTRASTTAASSPSDWVPINARHRPRAACMGNGERAHRGRPLRPRVRGAERHRLRGVRRAEAKQYTPAWAEKICHVPGRAASRSLPSLHGASGAGGFHRGRAGAPVIGCSYANSFETARAITAVNTLLGCLGRQGRRAAHLLAEGRRDRGRPLQGRPGQARKAKRVGDAEYPLALGQRRHQRRRVAGRRSTATIKGLFFYNSNAAKGYAQPKTWTEALGQVPTSWSPSTCR